MFQTDFITTTEPFVSASDFNNTEPNAPPAETGQTRSNHGSSTSSETTQTRSNRGSSTSGEKREENVVHILPETLVSGAVNVASTAFNTARSVINMIRPQEV